MTTHTPSIRFGREHEDAHAWRYEITITYDDGHSSIHEGTLAFVDYNHWSSGEKSPVQVFEAVLRAAFACDPDLVLSPRFDASMLRRRVPGLDEALIAHLGA